MSIPFNKIPSFDGLRAIAVVAVMLVHIGFPGAILGGLGVDLFFALSGFLITHLFIQEYRHTGRVRLGYFWLRRFLRLAPIYWLYLVLITALVYFGYGELTEYQGWSPTEYLLSMWLYFVNYLPAGGIWSEQFLTIHLWSLAIEEQFYLLWPLMIVVLFRYGVLLKGVLLILAVFLWYYISLASDTELLKTLNGRGITLFLGCVFAVLCNTKRYNHYFQAIPVGYSALLVLLVFVVMSALTYLGYYTEKAVKIHFSAIFGLLFCYLIASLYHQRGTFTHTVLELSPFVYVGKISYGIYLYHLGVQKIIWQFVYSAELFASPVDYLLKVCLYFMVTIGLASISFYFFESYFLRFKDRFRG